MGSKAVYMNISTDCPHLSQSEDRSTHEKQNTTSYEPYGYLTKKDTISMIHQRIFQLVKSSVT